VADHFRQNYFWRGDVSPSASSQHEGKIAFFSHHKKTRKSMACRYTHTSTALSDSSLCQCTRSPLTYLLQDSNDFTHTTVQTTTFECLCLQTSFVIRLHKLYHIHKLKVTGVKHQKNHREKSYITKCKVANTWEVCIQMKRIFCLASFYICMLTVASSM